MAVTTSPREYSGIGVTLYSNGACIINKFTAWDVITQMLQMNETNDMTSK